MKHPMMKYLKETGPCGDRFPTIFCPGCGIGQVLNYTLNAVDHLIAQDGIPQERFVFVSGIGCSARLTSQYLKFDATWSLHGRAPAVATGVLLGRPELKPILFTGDGDAGAIGGNHFIHACRRNLDLTMICMNNGLYGMTGGQSAPTTQRGTRLDDFPLRQRGKRLRPLPDGDHRRSELRGPLDDGPSPAVHPGHRKRGPEKGAGFHRNHDPVPDPLERGTGEDDEELPREWGAVFQREGKRALEERAVLDRGTDGSGSAGMAGNVPEDHRQISKMNWTQISAER